jgi:hypothetical protein
MRWVMHAACFGGKRGGRGQRHRWGRPLFYGYDGGGGWADGECHAVAREPGGGGVRANARQHVWAVFGQGRRGPMTCGPGPYSNGQRQNLIQIQISNGFELYSNSFKI